MSGMGAHTFHMRKIIAYIAVSADGYIARPDGGIEWLERPHPKGNYGMDDFFQSVDTILWGRKTYDLAMKMGGIDLFGKKMQHYVFSHRRPESDTPGVEFVREPIAPFMGQLRERP